MTNTQRYFISSVVTFLTGVCLVLINDIDSITLASFKDGTIAGLVFVAVRGGIKALIEAFLASRLQK